MQSFTYSGRLPHHQYEVHELHFGSRKLMYPFNDCNNSSGKDFTRYEILKEQLRPVNSGGRRMLSGNAGLRK